MIYFNNDIPNQASGKKMFKYDRKNEAAQFNYTCTNITLIAL